MFFLGKRNAQRFVKAEKSIDVVCLQYKQSERDIGHGFSHSCNSIESWIDDSKKRITTAMQEIPWREIVNVLQ